MECYPLRSKLSTIEKCYPLPVKHGRITDGVGVEITHIYMYIYIYLFIFIAFIWLLFWDALELAVKCDRAVSFHRSVPLLSGMSGWFDDIRLTRDNAEWSFTQGCMVRGSLWKVRQDSHHAGRRTDSVIIHHRSHTNRYFWYPQSFLYPDLVL